MERLINLNVKSIIDNINSNAIIDEDSYVVDREVELFLDAVEVGNVALVNKILDKGLDVSKPYLHKFLLSFNKSILKKLLSFKDKEDKRYIVVKYTSILDAALRFALEGGNYDMVYSLLNRFSNLNNTINLNEAFVCACQKNNLTIVRRLVENKNVDLLTTYGDFERVIDGGLYHARNSKATEVYTYLSKLNIGFINYE